jgi:hypothetical protein
LDAIDSTESCDHSDHRDERPDLDVVMAGDCAPPARCGATSAQGPPSSRRGSVTP